MSKYLYAFKLSLASSLEYRFGFFVSLFGMGFRIMAMLFLWKSIFDHAGTEVVFGYTFSQVVLYTIVARIVSFIILPDIAGTLSGQIKSGGLSSMLVRPINFFSYHLATSWGNKAFSMIVILILTAILLAMLSLSLGFALSLIHILLFPLCLAMSFVINYFFYCVLGMLSFWVLQIDGIYGAVFIVVNVLSGGYFPLSVFGPAFNRIAAFLPFPYMLQFPVNALSGVYDVSYVLQGLGVQLLWAGIFALISFVLWKLGLRKYDAVGG